MPYDPRRIRGHHPTYCACYDCNEAQGQQVGKTTTEHGAARRDGAFIPLEAATGRRRTQAISATPVCHRYGRILYCADPRRRVRWDTSLRRSAGGSARWRSPDGG